MLFTAAGGRLAEDDVIALGLAMIVILDWFIDRVETAQNVWSDCVACRLFDFWGYQDELSRDGPEKELATFDDGNVGGTLDEDESEKRSPGLRDRCRVKVQRKNRSSFSCSICTKR